MSADTIATEAAKTGFFNITSYAATVAYEACANNPGTTALTALVIVVPPVLYYFRKGISGMFSSAPAKAEESKQNGHDEDAGTAHTEPTVRRHRRNSGKKKQ